MYNTLGAANKQKATSTYTDTVTHLFGDPETFYDYCQELTNMVPPLKAVITIEKLRPAQNDKVRVKLLLMTDEAATEQHKIHNKWLQTVTTSPSDEQGLATNKDLSNEDSSDRSNEFLMH